MTDEEEEKQEQVPIDEIPLIEAEEEASPKVSEETLKQLSEYQLSLIPTCDSNVYKIIIEVNPPLTIGFAKFEKEQKAKCIVASQLELIAKSPNFSGLGEMTINILSGTYTGTFSLGKGLYSNPQKLKEDYLNLITKIKGKHLDNKGLKLKLFPVNPKPLNSKP